MSRGIPQAAYLPSRASNINMSDMQSSFPVPGMGGKSSSSGPRRYLVDEDHIPPRRRPPRLDTVQDGYDVFGTIYLEKFKVRSCKPERTKNKLINGCYDDARM